MACLHAKVTQIESCQLLGKGGSPALTLHDRKQGSSYYMCTVDTAIGTLTLNTSMWFETGEDTKEVGTLALASTIICSSHAL